MRDSILYCTVHFCVRFTVTCNIQLARDILNTCNLLNSITAHNPSLQKTTSLNLQLLPKSCTTSLLLVSKIAYVRVHTCVCVDVRLSGVQILFYLSITAWSLSIHTFGLKARVPSKVVITTRVNNCAQSFAMEKKHLLLWVSRRICKRAHCFGRLY